MSTEDNESEAPICSLAALSRAVSGYITSDIFRDRTETGGEGVVAWSALAMATA
jgi:hypothetical protein